MVAETEHVAVPPEIGFGFGIADSVHVAVLPDNAVVYVKLTSICIVQYNTFCQKWIYGREPNA